MTEEQFSYVTAACDRILTRSNVPLEWVAIPWLHVHCGHPHYLANYMGLLKSMHVSDCQGNDAYDKGMSLEKLFSATYKIGKTAKNILWGSPYKKSKSSCKLDFGHTNQIDIIIVSWLVNTAHLEHQDDFYFGSLQSLLAGRGLNSLLVLKNQTGLPTYSLLDRARRIGASARIMLPDTNTLFRELGYLKRVVGARYQLNVLENEAFSIIEKNVCREAKQRVVSNGTIANLRLHDQMVDLCQQVRPSIVISLYEGYSWERCLWRAVRDSKVSACRVGYQHTVLRKHAHSAIRTFGQTNQYDPDIILALGEITQNILQRKDATKNSPVFSFGSHRRMPRKVLDGKPSFISTFLVLPEGMPTEAIFLFEFAITCAKRLEKVKFIFRTHPNLDFLSIKGNIRGFDDELHNVEVSNKQLLEDDLERSGYVMYRGSSSVLYAVIAGLKPFYIEKFGEMSIDPLYELKTWRETIHSIDDWESIFLKSQIDKDKNGDQGWESARAYCDRYAPPVQGLAIDSMLKAAIGFKNTPPVQHRG